MFKSSAPPAPSWRFTLSSFLGAFIAIGAVGWLSQTSGFLWLMAPFGASCVLAFGLPDSPLAQPRSIVGGHLLSAFVGLLVLHALGVSWWSTALAVGLALVVMQQTRTVHAPAGANPLIVMLMGASFDFLLTPVLAGSLLIVGVAYGVNNLRQQGSYPKYWL